MQHRHFGVWPMGLPYSLSPVGHSVLHNLHKAAHEVLGRPAIWYYGRRIRFAELVGEVGCIAGFLHHRLGIAAGDSLALYMQNAPQFVGAYQAVLAATR